MVKYLFYCEPSPPICAALDAYKKQLQPCQEILSGYHCTLFSTRCDPLDEGRILSAVEGAALREPFELDLQGVCRVDKGRIAARIVRSDKLFSLHCSLVDRLKEFVLHDVVPSILPAYAKDPLRELRHNEYGNPYVLDFFSPHITICKNSSVEDPLPSLPSYEGWLVDAVHVAKKDCRWEKVARVQLNQI